MATEGGVDLRGLIEDVVEDRRRGADSCEIADAILGAIAEAGMVIVDAELNRLMATFIRATMDFDSVTMIHLHDDLIAAGFVRSPGDLDGPGGGEG